jgi:hypothetical protein
MLKHATNLWTVHPAPIFPLRQVDSLDSSAAPEVERGVYTLEVPTGPEPDQLFPFASPPLEADFTVN